MFSTSSFSPKGQNTKTIVMKFVIKLFPQMEDCSGYKKMLNVGQHMSLQPRDEPPNNQLHIYFYQGRFSRPPSNSAWQAAPGTRGGAAGLRQTPGVKGGGRWRPWASIWTGLGAEIRRLSPKFRILLAEIHAEVKTFRSGWPSCVAAAWKTEDFLGGLPRAMANYYLTPFKSVLDWPAEARRMILLTFVPK